MQMDEKNGWITNDSERESALIEGVPRQALFTLKETADIFKVHVRTVERWIEEQCLNAVVLPGGKSLRVPYKEISKVFSVRRR